MNRYLMLLGFILICGCKPKVEKANSENDFKIFIENFNASSENAGLSDLAAETFANEISDNNSKLQELLNIDTLQLSFEDKIDWRFAQSILKGKEIRQGKHQSWKRDPREYMQFRGLGNVIEMPGDVASKIEVLKERLKLIPQQLDNGQKQLEFYVPRFQELSLFMADNSKNLFGHDLPTFVEGTNDKDSLMPLIREAQQSLEKYIKFLTEELPKKPEAGFAMGSETYNQMLKDEFLLNYTDESLWQYGTMKFDETVAELETLAKEIDPSKTWQQLAIEIKNEYPEPHKMIEAHQLWVDSAKSHILSHKLIPIPWNERVQVVPRAEYLRKTSYYGNFSRAKGKDTDGILTAQWMINPYEDRWDKRPNKNIW